MNNVFEHMKRMISEYLDNIVKGLNIVLTEFLTYKEMTIRKNLNIEKESDFSREDLRSKIMRKDSLSVASLSPERPAFGKRLSD